MLRFVFYIRVMDVSSNSHGSVKWRTTTFPLPLADLCSGMDSASAAQTMVGHLEAWVSRRVGARGVADRGRWARSFIACGAPPGSPAPARFKTSSPTRRDTHVHPPPCDKHDPLACH
jgi:hypothetical protein